MPVLHRVREYTKRRGTSVREHLRGSGSKVKAFSGKYGGEARAKVGSASMSARDKIRMKLEQRRLENARRKAIRDEEQAISRAERDSARARRIRMEEQLRAREGGRFTRFLRGASRIGFHEGYRRAGGKRIVREYRYYASEGRRPIRGGRRSSPRKASRKAPKHHSTARSRYYANAY
jgi:hypothetical protein